MEVECKNEYGVSCGTHGYAGDLCNYGLRISKGLDASGRHYAVLCCGRKSADREHTLAGNDPGDYCRSIFLSLGSNNQRADWQGRWSFAGNIGDGMDTVEGHIVCDVQLFVLLYCSGCYGGIVAEREECKYADGSVYVDWLPYCTMPVNEKKFTSSEMGIYRPFQANESS